MLLELGVVPFCPVLAQKVPFGTIQAHLGQNRPFWYHSGPFRPIWSRLVPQARVQP